MNKIPTPRMTALLILLMAFLSSVTSAQIESELWENDGATWVPGISRLPDFTDVGYMNGSVAIPDEIDWPIGVDVTAPPYNAIPNDGIDDSQAFIDAIADCPDNHAVYVPNGRYTMLQQIIPDNDYFVLRGEDMYQTVLHYPKYLNEVYMQEAGYLNPAYDNGSNGPRHTGIGKGFIRIEGGTHRSIENLTFEFRQQRKMGHWEHKGASAVYYGGGVVDSWLRNIKVINGDNTIMMGSAQRLSFLNIIFDHYIGRPDIIGSGTSRRFVGHMALALSSVQHCLFHNIDFRGNYFHELDIANVPHFSVSSNFTGSNVSLHHHGQGANNNLYTNVYTGDRDGTRSLGSTQSNETHWRIYGDNILDDPLSVEAMNNDHIFVGYGSDASTFTDENDWYEAIDPATLYPANIYLAQLQHPSINKPLPEAWPVAPSIQFGDVIRINPVEDTFTDESNPNTVQDAADMSFSIVDDMYFKFDLNDIDLNSIAHVRFRVASSRFENTPVTLSVSSINDDSWSDDTLTYTAAQLLPTTLLDSIEINQDSMAQILEFDVTAFVQAEWAGDNEVSLVIKRTAGNGFLSGIRTSEMGIAPELVIEQVVSSVTGAPSAPTGIRTESFIGNVNLDWPDNPEADVATYNVYRSTVATEFRLYEEPIGMGLLTSDFLDIQDNHLGGWDVGMMRDDTVYYYRITAVDDHGYESASSVEVVGTAKGYLDDNLPPNFDSNPVVLPSATQYLTNEYNISSSISDPEGDPLYFFKIDGPDWVHVAHDGVITATPRLGDTGTYQINVQVNGLGGGHDEATVELTVDAAAPDAPLIVDVVPGDTTILLDWNHDAEGSSNFTFSVYRSTKSGGPYSLISSTHPNSDYTDEGLVNGTSYFYVITASNAFGESPNSDEVWGSPITGIALGTNFLGGDLNNSADWDAGLPTSLWGRIQTDGDIQPNLTDNYAVLQTSGTISNADFNGTSLSEGEWHLHGGTLSVRALTLNTGSTAFNVSGNGVADLGNNARNVRMQAGTSFNVNGGSVSLGRDLLSDGGTFTITNGSVTGDVENTRIGSPNNHANGVFNFNGGTTVAHSLIISGSNTTFNFGGDASGSLTVDALTGTNGVFNWITGSQMTLTVADTPDWAAAEWNAGRLTYNGANNTTLGSWATVTSTGLGDGVAFVYNNNTLSLSLPDIIFLNGFE